MNRVEDKIKKVGDEFLDKTKTIALASFGVVAALALNGAMMAYFEKFFSSENTPLVKLGYAFLLILILAILTKWFSKKTTEQPIIIKLNENEREAHIPLRLIIKLGGETEKDEPEKSSEPKKNGG